MKGVVVKTTGSWYEVRDREGNFHQCKLKGRFKFKGIRVTNPIAVGDEVLVSFESDKNTGVIYHIEPRRNYLIRTSVKHPDIGHILAANIDQAMLIVTLTSPRTSLGFIDRYLVSAETFRIPVTLVFNKIDLYQQSDLRELQGLRETYQKVGYEVLNTSLIEGTGLDAVKDALNGKTSLLSGHSGVGKSTMVNLLIDQAEQKVNPISEFSQKGIHTTTFAEMFQLNLNSFIIDTPGIKELGLMEIGEEELSHYFPEMRALMGQCKYHNCMHVHEPKCAVIDSIHQSIPESRYLSYLSMLENSDNRR
ncbi:MAG: putative ribosome biogenesis GTPase RsgA 2 [Cyclobacteriaceae bacterium]|nr:MAG: putative ribosome biogenesis GTPase RsgA 2 [Cyclobacteriaceae bacterium]